MSEDNQLEPEEVQVVRSITGITNSSIAMADAMRTFAYCAQEFTTQLKKLSELLEAEQFGVDNEDQTE